MLTLKRRETLKNISAGRTDEERGKKRRRRGRRRRKKKRSHHKSEPKTLDEKIFILSKNPVMRRKN